MTNHSKECIEAQKHYCEEKHLPMFMLPSGTCPRCNVDIFEEMLGGYSLEYASTRLITSCPRCRWSFCD